MSHSGRPRLDRIGSWPAALRGVVAVGFVAVGLVRAGSIESVLMYSAIWALAAIGVGLLLGWADQPLLCQASFMLVGAYIYGYLARDQGPSVAPLLALGAAAFTGAALAVLISPVLRVRGYTFALVTIALDLLIRRVLTTGDWIPGGQLGLIAIPNLAVGPVELDSPVSYLWFTSAVIVVAAVGLHIFLGRGRRRRALHLVADDEGLLAAFGRDAFRLKALLLVLAALLGALAGGIYASAFGFIQPSTFTLMDSFILAIAVAIGGKDRLLGAVFGALIFQLSFSVLGDQWSDYRSLLLGVTVIAAMHFFPEGLLPSRRDLAPWWPRARSSDDRAADATEPSMERAAPSGRRTSASSMLHRTAGMVLEVESAVQAFGSLRALDGAELRVEAGSLTALVGPNGAGKSTLLAAISGRQLTSGRVLFDGVDVTAEVEFRRARRRMAQTFQHVRLVDTASVLENVLSGVDLYVLSTDEQLGERRRRGLALDAIDRAGLSHLALAAVEHLSLAEKRLVEAVRALASSPRLLLLDEPTSGLDAAGCDLVGELIRQIHSEGCTVLLVEHNLSFARSMVTDVAALVDGRMLQHGPAGDVFASAQFADAYLGTGVGR